MKDDKTIYIVIVIFALVVLTGFYLVFDKLSGLQVAVEMAKFNTQLNSNNALSLPSNTPSSSEPSTSVVQNSPNIPEAPVNNDVIIPTGIIFAASSSPTLQPQVPITVTIDNITRKSNGTIVLSVKAFTDQATSYSAIDIGGLLQLVSLDADNQKPNDIKGAFNSMPPKSAVAGSIIFQGNPNKDSIILQIGENDNLKFYEVDFMRGTYKETTIG